MTQLDLTEDARSDTREILSYLKREAGTFTALDYGDRFRRTIERLLEMPESGAPRPGLGPNTRIAVVAPYLLIYDYTSQDDTVRLLRILHGRRNISADLLKR